METIQLPNSDLTVSRLCFGCWGIVGDFHWGDRDLGQSAAAIEAALDAGVNFFDTAAAYGNGDSEKLLGKVLAGRRDQVVIASKLPPDMMRPEEIHVAWEQALERLGTDYLDLFQTHWTSPDTPPADSWEAMLKLKQQGKVRHVGVCNMGRGDLDDICPLERPVTDQVPYSLLWRMIEHEILPRCREDGIGVLAYSPLMHGLLAGKYRASGDVPDGRARSRHFSSDRPTARHGEPGCEQETFAAIEAIDGICKGLGRSMADVALAWCVQQPGISCVIAGASTPGQVTQNVATFENPIPADAIRSLNDATELLRGALGPNPDMWDGAEKSRFR